MSRSARSTVCADHDPRSLRLFSRCLNYAAAAASRSDAREKIIVSVLSAVTLTIATDSLRSLPAGASYSERSGQASVKVSRKAATATEPEYIYVYASCDSLQLQCERYERQIRNLHSQYDERLNEMQNRLAATSHELEEVKEKPPNAIGTALKWYFYGLLSGILATIIIFIKLKK